jgi:O-antigen/teichoic acid export membrane protein
MRDRATLIGSALAYTLSNSLGAALPFLMLPILTRVLSPEEYGRVAMFSVLVSVLGAFTGLNVHGAVSIRYFERAQLDFPRYVGTCLLILAVSTAFVAALAWLLHPVIASVTQLPRDWLLAAVLVSGGQFVIQTQLAIWQSAQQPWRYGALRVSQSLLDASLSLVLVLGVGLAWQGRVAGIAIAVAATAIVALFLLFRGGWVSFPPSGQYAANALRFGVPLIPNALGGLMIGAGDRMIVSTTLGIRDLGIYTIAWQVSMVIGLLADAFVKAYGPWLYANLHEGSADALHRIVGATYIAFVFFAVLALVTYLLIRMFGSLLLGAPFMQAIEVLPWFLAGNALLGMYYAVIGLIFFSSRTEIASLITLVSGGLGMLCVYVMSRSYGMQGAAAGFLVGNAIAFVFAWLCGARLFRLPWSDLPAARRALGLRWGPLT